MKRAERQHALLDVLRATAPRPRSVRRLAEEFEVSTRTIERDIAALQNAGVPIYAEPGRRGGYTLPRGYSLPPLTFSLEEASAILAGLAVLQTSPYAEPARTAARKIQAGLPQERRIVAESIAQGVRMHAPEGATGEGIAEAVRQALTARDVLRLRYRDADGAITEREVEPLGLLLVRGNWIAAAWCRLRGAVRGFRLDWIQECTATGEIAPPRDLAVLAEDLRRWDFFGLPS